jgi:protein-tyrosine phosphatase
MKPEIYWIEGDWQGHLAIVARPRGGDWLEDEIHALRQEGFDVIVSLLTKDEADELGLAQEAKISAMNEIEFISFPIEDLSIPSSKWDFLELAKKLSVYLSQGKNVAVHCRQSVGRSSLIAASLLILSGLNVESALERVGKARGCVVPETEEQKKWLSSFSSELLYLNIRA